MRAYSIIVLSCCASSAAFAQSDSTSATYEPITGGSRAEWAIMSTISIPSFAAGLISAAWGTGFNEPHEYGTSLKGFGERYGMRFAGVATSNAMEASLGALTHEDPRYFRAEGQPFSQRLGHVVKMTFYARNQNGDVVPAYARYAAISGSNFLSNAWRADSEADAQHAIIRTGLGFMGRMSSNAFEEFWPNVKNRFFRRDH
jgi:hypothetical protein